ncbi:hypothetical protein BC829DRAFT_44063 [Chytridium lagenaria]|nr:hypothetical protein BC829DRAFT_44063 [Chytridium lagenaria]
MSNSDDKVFVPERKKLSIYDNPEDKYVVRDEPNEIELALRKTRLTVSRFFSDTRIQVDSVMSKWIETEKNFKKTRNSYFLLTRSYSPTCFTLQLLVSLVQY